MAPLVCPKPQVHGGVVSVKLAICIPCYGNPEAAFVQCLVNMINHFTSASPTGPDGEPIKIEWDVFIVGTSMLTEGRHRLVAEALAFEADYMLCLDADHTFPPDTLLRLWQQNKAVIGCNYARRVTPTAPTAADLDPDQGLLYTTKEKADADLVEQCRHLGFGVLLINMKVFDALQAHAEKEGKDSFLPLFLFEPSADQVGMIGEDVFFFRKLKDAGIVPWVDHALSWDVGHISKTIHTNAHAVSERKAWVAKYEADKAKREEKIAELEA